MTQKTGQDYLVSFQTQTNKERYLSPIAKAKINNGLIEYSYKKDV